MLTLRRVTARGRCLKHKASPVGEPLRVLLHGLSCEAGPESTPEHQEVIPAAVGNAAPQQSAPSAPTSLTSDLCDQQVIPSDCRPEDTPSCRGIYFRRRLKETSAGSRCPPTPGL